MRLKFEHKYLFWSPPITPITALKRSTHVNTARITLTCMNFIPTSFKPFFSKRDIISPISPRWTPSGFTIMNVLSLWAAMAEENEEQIARKVHTIEKNRSKRKYMICVHEGTQFFIGRLIKTRCFALDHLWGLSSPAFPQMAHDFARRR